jgi:putative nucleotidyltransferase with HDIG domain
MIRVLFVDDDPLILAGLKRLMRRFAQALQAEYVTSGSDALALLSQESFDAIVSDMRMPGMDGAELLNRVRGEFPEMVRLILSGQAPQESMFRALGPAHRFLSKPCRPDDLFAFLIRALRVRDQLANHDLRSIVGRIDKLPSIPRVYAELVEELHNPRGSMEQVGRIVAQDVAITAKLLHLVNSSFIGLRQHIASPLQAACLLGIELVKSLVLTAGVFSQFDQRGSAAINVEELAQHSIEVGESAHRIAWGLGATAQEAEEALLAGMMHDVGKLILATERAEEYASVKRLAAYGDSPLWQGEQAWFGTSHADIGAYLLSLWGLPNSIVEAVAFHHQPSRVENSTPVVLTAVHLANAIANETASAGKLPAQTFLDLEYMAVAGVDADACSAIARPHHTVA